MTDSSQTLTRHAKLTTQSLEGRRCWVITDGKRGMDVQCLGVGDALGVRVELKHVDPGPMWRSMAPWGPVAPSERFGEPSSLFAPPWPDIAISSGRQSVPYLRALRRAAGGTTYTVILQDPKTGPGVADLIWVPCHDRRRGANVITTLTAAHSFSPARLASLRANPPTNLAALPRPILGVSLGGPNSVYRFDEADAARLAAALAGLAKHAASLVVTPSRRTPRHVLAAVEAATRGTPRLIWDGAEPNPYADYLANADMLVVTADSVNMTGEASATGRPVYVFEPAGGSAKFRRFHDALRRHGATRPLPDAATGLESWHYEPLDSGAEIGREIERRWRSRHPA